VRWQAVKLWAVVGNETSVSETAGSETSGSETANG
jgi:hypothetical protein